MTGSPIGTGSSTPNLKSLSKPALTASCQWRGTEMGEWWAVGMAFGSMIGLIGGLSISGKGWCSQVLNVLDL